MDLSWLGSRGCNPLKKKGDAKANHDNGDIDECSSKHLKWCQLVMIILMETTVKSLNQKNPYHKQGCKAISKFFGEGIYF